MPPEPPPSAPAPHAFLDGALAAALERHKAGRLDEAEAAYREILRQAPEHADALHLLGLIARSRGRVQEAAALIERAVALNDASPVYHNNLGMVRGQQGRLDLAADCFRRALALDPRYLKAMCNLGQALAAAGRHDEAAEAYGRALALAPELAEAHYGLGCVLRDAGQLWPAVEHFRRAVKAEPRHVPALNDLAVVLKDLGEGEEAEAACHQALALAPEAPGLHNTLANALREQGRLVEAEAANREALRLAPDFAAAHNNLGYLLQAQGRFGEARAAYEACIARDPGLIRAHANLAILEKVKPGDPVVPRIEALLEKGGLPERDAAALNFALGKAYEDLGDRDRAFDLVRRANELCGGAGAFDAEAWTGEVDRIVATFTPAFLKQRRELGDDSERPIFVLGMPRSGTSLVEQILAAHPQVAGAGELNHFFVVVRDLQRLLGAPEPYPACAGRIDAEAAGRLRAGYLARLHKVSEDAARVVDKMPNNFLRLGLIAMLFPRARVIHCRRDPRDVCLSCHFQNFQKAHTYTHDLANLGRYYRQYERLMDHWRTAIPNPILELDYETLVTDQEAATRRMVEFCGLGWDDRCLAHHEGDQPILTASIWQARQPVNRSSLARWRRYEKHLAPLLEALEEGGADSRAP